MMMVMMIENNKEKHSTEPVRNTPYIINRASTQLASTVNSVRSLLMSPLLLSTSERSCIVSPRYVTDRILAEIMTGGFTAGALGCDHLQVAFQVPSGIRIARL